MEIEIEIWMIRDERHVSAFRQSNSWVTPSLFCLTRSSVKEVIQPQVPLRLPCYDFAPVMTLAFGRFAPCGFRHGLRALATSMGLRAVYTRRVNVFTVSMLIHDY